MTMRSTTFHNNKLAQQMQSNSVADVVQPVEQGTGVVEAEAMDAVAQGERMDEASELRVIRSLQMAGRTARQRIALHHTADD